MLTACALVGALRPVVYNPPTAAPRPPPRDWPNAL